jgi:hypothetical protein
MFTKPSVNQIEQAYTGNYQPLAAKVEQDKKQHGGIPHDLRQLLALNDIMQNRESAGIQQALNAPVNMPTVAQSMQQMAQQAIQARMMQQYQEQQRKDGKPMTVPPGVPQPDMQPRGIDSIPTDVGSGYAAGGIIGFSNGGNTPSSGELGGYGGLTPEQEAEAEIRAAEKERAKQVAVLEQKVAFLKSANAPQAQDVQMQLDALKADMRPKPSPTDPNFRRQTDPRMSGVSSVAPSTPLITSGTRQSSSPKPATVRDNAPMPAGERPAAGLDAYLATPQKVLTTAMNVDPNQELKDRMAMYKQLVGEQPTTGLDRMIAELDRRKAKLEGEAPKTGFAGLMDYLGHIAGAGGKTWQDAGYAGSVSLQKANKAREEQINALIEKGIDLAQKKEDVGYGFKKESYGLGLKAMEDAVKRKYDSAIALENNALEREKLKQQKEAELARLAQMRVNPVLQLASALQGATPEKRDAILQSAGLMYGNRQTGSDAALLKDYETAITKVRDAYKDDIRKYGTPADKAALKTEIENELAKVEARYTKYGIGGQGASTSAKVVDFGSLPK